MPGIPGEGSVILSIPSFLGASIVNRPAFDSLLQVAGLKMGETVLLRETSYTVTGLGITQLLMT